MKQIFYNINVNMNDNMDMEGPSDQYHQRMNPENYERFQANQEQSFLMARDEKEAFMAIKSNKHSSNSRSRDPSLNNMMAQSLNNSGLNSGSRGRNSNSNGSKGSNL